MNIGKNNFSQIVFEYFRKYEFGGKLESNIEGVNVERKRKLFPNSEKMNKIRTKFANFKEKFQKRKENLKNYFKKEETNDEEKGAKTSLISRTAAAASSAVSKAQAAGKRTKDYFDNIKALIHVKKQQLVAKRKQISTDFFNYLYGVKTQQHEKKAFQNDVKYGLFFAYLFLNLIYIKNNWIIKRKLKLFRFVKFTFRASLFFIFTNILMQRRINDYYNRRMKYLMNKVINNKELAEFDVTTRTL